MPSSQHYQINEIMDLIVRTDPSTVLDIGPGFGKYGFLCREYLELWDGRNVYGDWKRRIDCIEAFPDYITPLHRLIYDHVYTGNALEILPGLDQAYDLILMVDVFEHFTYEEGMALMKVCRAKAKHILIATPKFVNMQEDAFGNAFEQHRFEWKRSHLKAFGPCCFAPHHSTLICLVGEKAPALGRASRRDASRRFLKKTFPFLSRLRRVFN